MSIFRYFIVGAACALIDFAGFASFLYLFRASWFTSAIISFSCATLANLTLSKRYVFKTGHRFKPSIEAVLVFVVSGIGLALNQLMLYMQIVWLDSHLMIAKVVATIAVFGWNYTTRRYLIFGVTR